MAAAQATDNAVGFYETLGFVRVGAVAAVRPEPVTAAKAERGRREVRAAAARWRRATGRCR